MLSEAKHLLVPPKRSFADAQDDSMGAEDDNIRICVPEY